MDDNFDKLIEDFDIETAGDDFSRHVLTGGEPGSTFRDANGKKWKYLASDHDRNQHVASHGEFCIVVTLTHKKDMKYDVEVELKRRT